MTDKLSSNSNSNNCEGFPNGSSGKESPVNAGETGDASLIPEWGRSPEGDGKSTPVFLPGESNGQRNQGRLQFIVSKENQTEVKQFSMHADTMKEALSFKV